MSIWLQTLSPMPPVLEALPCSTKDRSTFQVTDVLEQILLKHTAITLAVVRPGHAFLQCNFIQQCITLTSLVPGDTGEQSGLFYGWEFRRHKDKVKGLETNLCCGKEPEKCKAKLDLGNSSANQLKVSESWTWEAGEAFATVFDGLMADYGYR